MGQSPDPDRDQVRKKVSHMCSQTGRIACDGCCLASAISIYPVVLLQRFFKIGQILGQQNQDPHLEERDQCMNVFCSGNTDGLKSFWPGQKVRTNFGPGVVSAFSEIDLIVYVALSNHRSGLYLFRPEQVERLEPAPTLAGIIQSQEESSD
jgi:hypothetical protein